MSETCCAYFVGNECKETYLEHIYCMLKVWEGIKKFYIKNLRRVVGVDDVEDLVKIAILSHDAGKLLEEYKHNKVMFRHEVIGSYVAYNLVKEEARMIVSSAVLLHHESGILSIYAGQFKEKYVPISTIKAVLENAERKGNLRPYCELCKDPYYPKVKNLPIGEMTEILKRITSKDVVKVVKRVIIYSISDNSLIFRNKVSAFLHVLTLVDSVAANLNRSDTKDEGTWITKMAQAGAEILPDINCDEK